MTAGAYHRPPEEYARSRAFSPEAEAQVADSLARLIPPGRRVADLGAGTGRLAHMLLARGYPVVAYDLSRRMLAYLEQHRPKSRVPLRTIQGELERLPFAQRAFAAAVCVHVLHLLSDWRLGLVEALRIVEPDGTLLFGWTDHVQDDPTRRISSKWKEILSERGLPRSNSLSIRDEVVPWLRDHGWPAREVIAAHWTRERSPQEHLDQVEAGLYPFFREIPEAAFPEVFSELRSWAERTLAPLDRAVCTPVSFQWLVVSIPRSGAPGTPRGT